REIVGRHPYSRVAALYRFELARIEIGYRTDRHPGHFGEVAQEVRAPITVTDDADIDHVLPSRAEIRTMPPKITTRPRTLRNERGSLNSTTAPAVTRANVRLTRTG